MCIWRVNEFVDADQIKVEERMWSCKDQRERCIKRKENCGQLTGTGADKKVIAFTDATSGATGKIKMGLYHAK